MQTNSEPPSSPQLSGPPPATPGEPTPVAPILPRWRKKCHWLSGLMIWPVVVAVAGNLTAPWWWVSDLTLHFAWQAATWALVTTVLATLGRRRYLSRLALLALVWHLSFIAPLYWGRHTVSDSQSAAPFKAMAFNVYARNTQSDQVIAFVTAERPDILCVEELTTYWHRSLKDQFPHYFAIPNDGAFGGGIYSRYPLTEFTEIPLSDHNISLQATAHLPSGPVKVIVIHCFPCVSHGATQLRNNQIRAMAAHVEQLKGPVLLLGDFNSSMWTAPMQELLHTTGLHDSTRGFGLQTTWPAGNPILRTPIDHVLVSSEIEVLRRRIGPACGSDHFSVIVECKLQPASVPPSPSADAQAQQ